MASSSQSAFILHFSPANMVKLNGKIFVFVLVLDEESKKVCET